MKTYLPNLKKNKIQESLKAIRKADRELELELNGNRWKAVTIKHKNKKKYDRKNKQLYREG